MFQRTWQAKPALLLALAIAASAFAQTYEIVAIPTMSEVPDYEGYIFGRGVSDASELYSTQVVGYFQEMNGQCCPLEGPGPWRLVGFTWSDGVGRRLEPLPQHVASEPAMASTLVRATNDAGQIVGYSNTFIFPYIGADFAHFPIAVCWEPDGQITELGVLPGDQYSDALDINNAGGIVGVSCGCTGNDDDADEAFFWSKAAGLIGLGTLGGANSKAKAINARGQVVGVSDTADGMEHAFLWENGVMIDLGTPADSWSNAYDINDAGQIVGTADFGDGRLHGFLYSDGEFIDLGKGIRPVAINNAGQIVGESGEFGEFLWQAGVFTKLIDLLPPAEAAGWSLWEVEDINDAGEIAGTGNHDGVQHAYLLRPRRMLALYPFSWRIEPRPTSLYPWPGLH